MKAIRKLARLHLRQSEIEFDVVYRAGMRHRATNGLWRLRTAGAECNLIDDALPVMSVGYLPKDETEGQIKPDYVIENCDNTGATASSSGLLTICSITTPRAETTTSTLTEPVTEQPKDSLC